MADFSALCEGTLISQLAPSTTTSVTIQLKKVNGVYSSVTWPTGAHEIMLVRETEDGIYAERCPVAAGTSQSNTTGVVTLGTITRNCSLTDGTDTTGSAATITWPVTTKVYVPWGIREADRTVFTNEAQTITGNKTYTGSITMSGTGGTFQVPQLTTTQRTGLSATNGMFVYDTDLSQVYKYEGSAWAAVTTGSFSNAANGTAGKVDLATAAEVVAGTANDASSGAANVIPVTIVKTSSTGAVNGTVPALNASVALDRTIGGLGTVTGTTAYTLLANGTTATAATQNLASAGTSNQVLTSNGAAALPTFQDAKSYVKPVFTSGTSSATLTNPTSETNFATYTYTIPANDLVAGVKYRFEFAGDVTVGTSGNLTLGVRLGAGSDLTSALLAVTTSGTFVFSGWIMGTTTAGAASSVRASCCFQQLGLSKVAWGAQNAATDGTLAILFSALFGTSNGSNAIVITNGSITKEFTTAS